MGSAEVNGGRVSKGGDLIAQLISNLTSRVEDPRLLEKVRREAAHRVMAQGRGDSRPAKLDDETVASVTTGRFTLTISSLCKAQLLMPGLPPGDRVPFASLYNPVADARPQNFEACVAAKLLRPGVLRVSAAHGYGFVDVAFNISRAAQSVQFRVDDTANWATPRPDAHIAFGQFWQGVLDNRTTHPLVMGKVMGPYGIPAASFSGEAPVSAGFVTLGRGCYYNTLFATEASDRPQLAFAAGATDAIPETWMAIAREQGMLQDNPHRFATWMWTPVTEHDKETMVARAKALGAQLLFIDQAMDDSNWTFYQSKYPSGIGHTAAYIRSQGILVGLHTLPYPPTELVNDDEAFVKEALVPEGLAPTYRSGLNWVKSGEVPGANIPTEDLGYWYGHEKQGRIAANGNPHYDARYGWECPQAPGSLNCSRWGSNMTLTNCFWSTSGIFRDGGAIGFRGSVDSYGYVPHITLFDSATTQLTLGMTVHLSASATEHEGMQLLAQRAGAWRLWLDSAMRLRWSVNTTRGPAAAASSPLLGRGPFIVKATLNSTTVRLFVDNNQQAVGKVDSTTETTAAARIVSSTAGILVGKGFAGALEEVYLKNVSTEQRKAYLYTDNARCAASAQGGVDGAFVFDLVRPSARQWYAENMARILNAADFDVTQWDGL